MRLCLRPLHRDLHSSGLPSTQPGEEEGAQSDREEVPLEHQRPHRPPARHGLQTWQGQQEGGEGTHTHTHTHTHTTHTEIQHTCTLIQHTHTTHMLTDTTHMHTHTHTHTHTNTRRYNKQTHTHTHAHTHTNTPLNHPPSPSIQLQKSVVLQKTIDFIRHLESTIKRLQDENAQLKSMLAKVTSQTRIPSCNGSPPETPRPSVSPPSSESGEDSGHPPSSPELVRVGREEGGREEGRREGETQREGGGRMMRIKVGEI